MMKALESGFKAAGMVMDQTARMVLWDVGEVIFSRLIAGGQIADNLYGAKSTAEEISQRIIKIRNQIHGSK
jgi:hypothetical protein